MNQIICTLAISACLLCRTNVSAKDMSATTIPGIDSISACNYFTSTLNGEAASLKGGKRLKTKDIESSRDKVWQWWRTAVSRQQGEKLPTLSDHKNLKSWSDIETPDGVWSLPEGDMKYFYGTKGERPDDGYPLLLFIHGSGQDNDREWTVSLGWAEYFNDGNTAYFIPRSPLGGTGCRWYQPSRQEKWENIMRQAFASGDVNALKFYIMGISEGAYGSQRLASFYADYLAGAGPIAGGELLINCPPENLANTAFCLQTGEDDVAFGRDRLTRKVNSRLDSLSALRPGKYIHKIDLQPGKGHGCDYTVTTPWLVQHTRNPRPDYFYWENYGMGGINGEPRRYRDGFYNLRILTPSVDRTDDRLRTAYEMAIDGNTVNLTVNNVTITPSEHCEIYGWEVDLDVNKSFTPAKGGSLRVYLNEDMVDFSRPVTINVNGQKRFHGKLKPSSATLVESCAFFFDPERIFPAAVDVTIPD